MAVPSGVGAVPTGGLFNELTAVTRRAFVPKCFVQIYFATPTLMHLLSSSLKAGGGLSQLTIPVQGNSMVQGQYVGPSGGFNSPTVTPGMQVAQFPMVYWVVPVPLYFGERVLQSSSETVISTLKARMNDVYAVTSQQFATNLFTNNTANALAPNSFIDGFDNGTNVASYGGINRNSLGNSFWQGQFYNVGTSYATGATRALVSTTILQVQDKAGGELPDFAIMSPGDFAKLNTDFVGIEQINPGVGAGQYGLATTIRSSFPNININGVPIYCDHFCPTGSMFYVNKSYTNMYLDEYMSFEFTGFQSLQILNQIGQQGTMVTGYNVATAKPVANAVLTNIGGASF
jgi:hypothetical protein